jgi:response regulator RpfG family c-di-GMP phosphodiesterase
MKFTRSRVEPPLDSTPQKTGPRHTWKLLVVDDEPDVRAITRLNLKGFRFDERDLEILEADSARQAKEILQKEKDIAAALVDVVMETDDAGLKLVQYIREELGNHMMRLVIRTGQPGLAPERFVIDNFDIDDYHDKTEMTATRLYTTVRSTIKSYRDLKTIDLNRIGLEQVLEAAPDIYHIGNTSIQKFFDGVLTQIVGLCNLSEGSFISTIPGMIATLDGQEVTVHATTGNISDLERMKGVRDECTRIIVEGRDSGSLRKDTFVVTLNIEDKPVGFIYIEPTRDLSDADRDLIKITARQCSSALENLRLHLDLETAYDNVIEMLAQVAEFKDKTTGEHIRRIDNYTQRVSLEMGATAAEAALYGQASRLHDIGKVGIPDNVLCKAGKLDENEYTIMKTHTNIGGAILSRDAHFSLAHDVALNHHERWDSKGYPAGIPARELPLATRIVSVVDVFDALISHRHYKDSWPVEKAVAVIKEGAGTQFDPLVVNNFLRLLQNGKFDDLITSAQGLAERAEERPRWD